jgi:O-antigen/teichoic acid export membrane protein
MLLLTFFVSLDAEGAHGHVLRYLRSVLPLVALLWSALCCAAAFFGQMLVPLFFGPAFALSARLLWPFFAAVAFAGPLLAGYEAFSKSISATYISAFSAIVAAVANVALDLILIPRFGLPGAAWATTAAYASALLIWSPAVSRLGVDGVGLALASTTPALLAAMIAAHFSASLAVASGLLLAGLIALLFSSDFRRGIPALRAVLRPSAELIFRPGLAPFD